MKIGACASMECRQRGEYEYQRERDGRGDGQGEEEEHGTFGYIKRMQKDGEIGCGRMFRRN